MIEFTGPTMECWAPRICPVCDDEMSELMFGEYYCDSCQYVEFPEEQK